MRLRDLILPFLLLATCGMDGVAQSRETRAAPFSAIAGTAGATAFTAGGASQGTVGAYGYVALSRLILGAQAGRTTSATPDVIYGMATLGWPARAVRQSLVYPFVGAGHGVLHGSLGRRASSAVFGAGVGADQVLDQDGFGLLLGFRGGYLFRPGDVGERAVYFSVSLGVGGQRIPEDKPPVIIASRGAGRS